MKNQNLMKLLAITVVIFITQALMSQSPEIYNKYSDDEITNMLKQYKVANSHDILPPSNLQEKLMSNFPNAKKIEWESDGNIYEAEFEINWKDFKAFYDKEGNLIYVSEEITSKELPAIVKNTAENKHPKYLLSDLKKIRHGSETFYKLEMERGEIEYKLTIQSDGKIINENVDY